MGSVEVGDVASETGRESEREREEHDSLRIDIGRLLELGVQETSEGSTVRREDSK